MIIYRKLMLLLSKLSRRECVLLLDHCCFTARNYFQSSSSTLKRNADYEIFTREPLLIARRSRMHLVKCMNGSASDNSIDSRIVRELIKKLSENFYRFSN